MTLFGDPRSSIILITGQHHVRLADLDLHGKGREGKYPSALSTSETSDDGKVLSLVASCSPNKAPRCFGDYHERNKVFVNG